MRQVIINKFLKDEIIDLKKLLVKKYKTIGLSEKQVVLLLNIIDLNESNKITINSISKKTNLSRMETEDLVGELIKSKLIKVKHTKNGLVFNYSSMFENLLSLYYPPEDFDSVESKVSWIANQLKINITPSSSKYLTDWINNGGWSRLLSIVEEITKLQITNINFLTLKKLYLSEQKEKSASVKNLKEILDINWLES